MKKRKYIFYGFERIGFTTPNANLQFREFEIEFCEYGNSETDWHKVEGLIVPSSIFETFEYNSVKTDEKTLLEIENEAHNLIRAGKWVAILAQHKFTIDWGYDKTIYHTDLAKKIVKNFGSSISPISTPFPVNETRLDQFRNYLKHYGVAKNRFSYDGSYSGGVTIISGEWRKMHAYEQNQLLFVLPFHSNKKTENDLKKASSSILESICDYLVVKKVELPDWVNEFNFIKEEELTNQYKALSEQLENVENELKNHKEYKLSLTTTGENLREVVIKILQDFFNLKIDPIDNNLEDFKILNEESIIVFGEVKGSKKGVKREHINQVDSHRERAEVDSSIPGLLIINNQMSLNSIEERNSTIIPSEHIKHAALLNIIVIRTIDLLNLMKQQEKENEKNLLIENIQNGGGWLKVTEDKIELLNE